MFSGSGSTPLRAQQLYFPRGDRMAASYPRIQWKELSSFWASKRRHFSQNRHSRLLLIPHWPQLCHSLMSTLWASMTGLDWSAFTQAKSRVTFPRAVPGERHDLQTKSGLCHLEKNSCCGGNQVSAIGWDQRHTFVFPELTTPSCAGT